MYLNVIKSIYDQPTTNIIFKWWKAESILLNSGIRQRSLLSTLLLNIVLEVLASSIKEIKGNQIGSKELKWSLYAYNIPCVENPNVSTQKTIRTNNEVSKVAGKRLTYINQFHFSILTMKYQKEGVPTVVQRVKITTSIH